MGHKFHILDVFTKQRFAGNQLAVVMDADDLDDEKMQAITREFGFSETVFLQSSLNPVASTRLKIFTPAQEIPFAGHPTIGAAVLLNLLMSDGDDQMADSLLVLEEGIGAVRVAVSNKQGDVGFAEFDAPFMPEVGTLVPEANEVADALGISIADVGFENHKIHASKAGLNYVFVPVKNVNVLDNAHPNFSFWDKAFDKFGPMGVYVYCRNGGGSESRFHSRMFAPNMGVYEDPATGSAAVAFANVLQAYELDDQTFFETVIEQGRVMGRPSQIKLELELSDRQIRAIRVGGHAVLVGSGTMN